jgi:hypothetical protein
MTWVFCAGMIRSGSTVQYQLTAAIIESAICGRRVPYVPESDFVTIRDSYDFRFAVFKAHVCNPDLSRECLNNGAKVVYSYRDIRDVAVSAMRKFEMTFDELIKKGWLDQAIEDYHRWTAMPDVLISRYESFHDSLIQETRKISDFLQITLSDQMVEHIGRDFQTDRQKERIARLRPPDIGPSGREELVFDPRELLHWNHLHDGQAGAWITLLSQDQRSCLTHKFSDWLLATGYSIDDYP